MFPRVRAAPRLWIPGMTDTIHYIPRVDAPPALEQTAAEFDLLDPTVRMGTGQGLVIGPQVPLDAIKELGPYRILQQLGSGGMGIVFEVEDTATGEHFALKVLRPTLVMEPEAKIRFFREAEAMAAIGHQRVVPVIRVGEEFGLPYICMPLLLGETLDDRLNRAPAPTLDEIIRIGVEIAEGLEAAHQQRLIHRDVKPANIWLEEPFGSVRLLDLGLVREITRETLLTQNGIIMGTPAYMAPEQARGEELDPRSDLFSLGCILYQMTTGNRPFDGPSPLNVLQQLETYNPPRVSVKNPRMPAMLSNLIMELLAKQANDRPLSAFDVMDRLRRIPLNEEPKVAMPAESGAPVTAYEPFLLDDSEKMADVSNGANRNVSVAILLALLAAAGGVGYFILQ